MSRVALVALLGAALLALPASAQLPPTGATFSFEPQSTTVAVTNGTFVARAFDAALVVGVDTCPSGGSALIEFMTTVKGGNGSIIASLSPPSLSYSLGLTVGTGVAGARTFATEVSVMASTPRLVTAVANATITVTATPSFTCTGGGPTVAAQSADLKVSFVPDDAIVAANQPSEIVPGFELPLLALGLLGAILVARRRQA